MNKAVSWVVVVAAIGGGYFWLSTAERKPPVITDVVVPEFSALAAQGEVVFQGTCAACHAANLAGTENGPPLVVKAYRTAMHSDFAISSAINNGVVAHHWRFGSMPPQDNIAPEEVEQVIAYIREMQAANGIE